ncbi:TraB/GumN family protein [Verrucomicrobiales bacterium]|nr:TraB/GumN family protein [Verrucomicrobiales bacterium]
MKKTALTALAFIAAISPAETKSEQSAVWSISDHDSTVYLAGSVHVLRETDLPIPKIFKQAYDESEEIVFEIDMAKMTDPGMVEKMREMGTLPASETLADKLKAETVEKLKAYLATRNVPFAIFKNFTPGMAYLTMTSLEAIKLGARPDLGLESQYFDLASKDEKPSRGLETAEYQMSRFNEFSDEEMDEVINKTLDEVDEMAESLNELITIWKSGDMKELEALIIEQMAPTPRVKKILLDERNENWIPAIKKSLAEKHNVMFLVGAAHLVGEGSVVDLLEKKGLTVTNLENE